MDNDYIRRSDVESLIKSFCIELIEAHREIDEVDFNAELQERLKALPGVNADRIQPCAVGDAVYQVVDRLYESKIRGVIFDTDQCLHTMCCEIEKGGGEG